MSALLWFLYWLLLSLFFFSYLFTLLLDTSPPHLTRILSIPTTPSHMNDVCSSVFFNSETLFHITLATLIQMRTENMFKVLYYD